MALKYIGTFDDLKNVLSSLKGEWDSSQENKKILKVGEGILNWFPSKGTIQFQGKSSAKSSLEKEVLHLLSPEQHKKPKQEVIDSSSTSATFNTQNFQQQTPESESESESESERKYLESDINDSELIIGIVSAVGTESRRVIESLDNRLRGFSYTVKTIKLSLILPPPTSTSNDVKEFLRIKHYMEAGNNLRKESKNNAILAAGAAKEIKKARDENVKKIVYIIDSLKHPKEVEFLRKVYTNGFYLIGIHADPSRRHQYLTADKGCTEDEADKLIKIDEDENIDHGQKTRNTYHLADFFLNLSNNTDQVKNHLQRFLELIFSHPYRNPTFNEFAMFMAFNSSVRSSDLSRQVGAVISQDQQIIATGANDVPKSDGGSYWAEENPKTGEVTDKPDGKDYKRGHDSNKSAQTDIIQQIKTALLETNIINSDQEDHLSTILEESKISDLTEFGRVVHAEMDALLSCSRVGISTKGATLYCTTFPCHNCAKHIIASGIKKVVYVEPYPKSRALELYSDSILLKPDNSSKPTDTPENNKSLVMFEPFTGVGPRCFLNLFSMSLGAGFKMKRKDKDGRIFSDNRIRSVIRTPIIPKSYLEIEDAAVGIWDEYDS